MAETISPGEQALAADGARRVAEFVRHFLVRHAPFNRMQAEALAFLSERLEQVFFAAGSIILTPESGSADYFYIIEHGKVQARQAGEVKVTEYAVLTLGAGESFPIGAVSARRASTNQYAALEDTFCYRLSTADFHTLQTLSPEFNQFCTQYIASLLLQSRQELQVQFAQRASEQQTLNSPLLGIGSRKPVTVPPGMRIRAALEIMAERRVGSLVVEEEGKPVGIFTQSDLLRRVVLADTDQQAPIATIMTPDPAVLEEHATAYDAMLAMATRQVRHLCVVDRLGKLTGVVSERDLFALQRTGLRQIRQGIESATEITALQAAAADVRQLACNMLAQGIGPQQLTQFVSALNDALTRRILELNAAQHDLGNVSWCWLAFGSEGRDEQTFSTDQDNGIVFVPGADDDRDALRERFLAFALAVNKDLDRCGFQLCKGNIMASNPQWCLTLAEWEEQFAAWVRNPVPEALLNATIFFDFRPLYGQHALAETLRQHLMTLTTSTPLFLKAMASNALDVAPPLGTFRDFRTDLEAEHPGKIDLKKYGVRLFVDVARIYALANGVAATNTVQRLRQSATLSRAREDEMQAAVEAFDFIQLVRLRHQVLECPPGEGDNLIAPEALNELDRRILKESFRQARKLQARLKLDYQMG